MKNATGISRWTSAGRNHAVHILNDEGSLVLCKKQFFSHNTSALDVDKVTCSKCLRVFKKLNIYDVSKCDGIEDKPAVCCDKCKHKGYKYNNYCDDCFHFEKFE